MRDWTSSHTRIYFTKVTRRYLNKYDGISCCLWWVMTMNLSSINSLFEIIKTWLIVWAWAYLRWQRRGGQEWDGLQIFSACSRDICAYLWRSCDRGSVYPWLWDSCWDIFISWWIILIKWITRIKFRMDCLLWEQPRWEAGVWGRYSSSSILWEHR